MAGANVPPLPPGFEVREASLQEIVDLRHAILRFGLSRDAAIFDGDHEPSSIHVAAVSNGKVVGCATVHLNQWQGSPAWQLRGMATDENLRRTGVGRAMLELLERLIATRSPIGQLWCNARTPAIPFYERLGWRVESEIFEIPTAGPHVRMTKILKRDEPQMGHR